VTCVVSANLRTPGGIIMNEDLIAGDLRGMSRAGTSPIELRDDVVS
jgi:hypothetical protein